MQKKHTLENFEQLGISGEVLKAIEELGFKKPTEIQAAAIPKLMNEPRDLIGLAQTGTGKTAAFGLPLIEAVNASEEYTQGLILAPTRELGKQIAEQLHLFGKYKEKINMLAVYGGQEIRVQIRALKKTQHVIIATPGRLIDLIKRKAVKLNQLKFLVLDEADEMLNMGFKDELDEILQYTPDDKLTWLFSATMPDFIKKIVAEYMHDPFEIRINPKSEINKNIKHRYVVVKTQDKSEALKRFLDIHGDMRGVVFCRTKRDTQELAERLISVDYKVDALHGDLSQAQRDRVMQRFRKNELQLLVATDVAARGIDVQDLSHVFHFSLPDSVAYYTHRSGRTARAGKKGVSICFTNGRERYKLNRIEKTLKIEFKKILVPESKDVLNIRVRNWAKNVLNTPTKKKLDPELLDQAITLFGNLSKEELIAKVLMNEYEKFHIDSDRNLNYEEQKSKEKGGRGGKGKKHWNKRGTRGQKRHQSSARDGQGAPRRKKKRRKK